VWVEVTRLELMIRRRATIGYSLGMAIYTFVIVALYPQFEHLAGANSFVKNDPTVSALMGISGSFDTPNGWLDGNIYDNFLPLVMLLLTVGYGASAIAGRDEEKTLALVASLPVARGRIVLQTIAAMLGQAVALVAAVAVIVLAGRAFGLSVPVGRLVEASIALLALGIDFGLIALAVGAATGNRGVALGVGAAIAAASYLVSSLAPVVAWIRPVRFVSLFYWAVGNGELTHGLSTSAILVLVLVGVLLVGASIEAFDRLDLH
jgi:ABC-2 type transport system permease protein